MDIGACTERTMRARDDVYKVPLKAPEAELAASGLQKENSKVKSENAKLHREVRSLT